jgi:DNA adenine methylase
VVNLHHQIKKGLQIEESFDMSYDRDLYDYRVTQFNQLIAPASGDRHAYLKDSASATKAAKLLYYFNRRGYNGIVRLNLAGEWNVPFGRESPYIRDFSEYRQVMQGWTFCYGDFASLRLKSQDFLILDPPYAPMSQTANFTEYGSGRFTRSDQDRLLKWAIAANVPFIICNHATPEIETMYTQAGLNYELFSRNRPISVKTSNRSQKINELIAFNF